MIITKLELLIKMPSSYHNAPSLIDNSGQVESWNWSFRLISSNYRLYNSIQITCLLISISILLYWSLWVLIYIFINKPVAFIKENNLKHIETLKAV